MTEYEIMYAEVAAGDAGGGGAANGPPLFNKEVDNGNNVESDAPTSTDDSSASKNSVKTRSNFREVVKFKLTTSRSCYLPLFSLYPIMSVFFYLFTLFITH